jgi:hypothetical protein
MVLAAPGGWGAKKRDLIQNGLFVPALFSPKYFSLAFSSVVVSVALPVE